MKITVFGVDTDETDDFEAPMLVWTPDGDGELHIYEGSPTAADTGRLPEVALFSRGQWRLILVREQPASETEQAVWQRAQRRMRKKFEK